MANRAGDWMRQAEADLRLAATALGSEAFEWSCFAAHQAAEKAIKGVFLHLGMEAWGHSVRALLSELASRTREAGDLMDAAKGLDKHYIPTRYPNGFDQGAPTDYYTRRDAEEAIGDARRIIDFCAGLLGRP